jgi:hypothetical protein
MTNRDNFIAAFALMLLASTILCWVVALWVAM